MRPREVRAISGSRWTFGLAVAVEERAAVQAVGGDLQQALGEGTYGRGADLGVEAARHERGARCEERVEVDFAREVFGAGERGVVVEEADPERGHGR